MDNLLADLRYAGRGLLKRPGFTVVALLIMAFGIGANSAIFSIVNAVLLRPLPVERPEELVEIYSQEGDEIPATQSFPDFVDIREREDIYIDVIAYSGNFFAVSQGTRTEVVLGESVSGNYFEMLGVRPYRGRLFNESEDDAPGAAPAVVISHGLWERRFGSDPDVVGLTLTLKGRPFDIIGVTPPDFSGQPWRHRTGRSPEPLGIREGAPT
jgi:putative ABC transport system permease protein